MFLLWYIYVVASEMSYVGNKCSWDHYAVCRLHFFVFHMYFCPAPRIHRFGCACFSNFFLQDLILPLIPAGA